MCTAISFRTKDHYFGRTLDYEVSYGERIVVTPRNFPLSFRHLQTKDPHFAMIGMAVVAEGYPLYFDATNEKGLSIAGLNFPDNAYYYSYNERKDNVAPFELIPWLLSQCADIGEVKRLIGRMNIVKTAFSSTFPLSPLHWLVSDRSYSIVIESRWDGMHVYDNALGVLTNNPPFEMQLHHLQNYLNVSNRSPRPGAFGNYDPTAYSRGMGGMGLPGDLTSSSRFVRAVFAKQNSVCGSEEMESVSQFFHILGYVEQVKGCVEVTDGSYEITRYASCCNTERSVYYYKTYNNAQISCVSLFNENLEASEIAEFPLKTRQNVYYHN